MLAAAALALGITTGLPRSVSKVLSHLNVSEGIARAQGVGELKTFSLKTLREWDAKADTEYGREFVVAPSNDKTGTIVRVTGEKSNHLLIIAAIDSQEKGIGIQYPKDRSNPNGERTTVNVDLQKLFDYYVEAGGKAKNPWVKVILDVDDAGVTIWAALVDEKPKPNDSSDIKAGIPIIGVRYRKESNDISAGEAYRRVEEDTKVAHLSAKQVT